MAESLANLAKGDEKALVGLFKTKDFSQAVVANVSVSVDISISGYTPISIICTGTISHAYAPLLQSNNTHVYVGCTTAQTLTWRVVYIKNGVLNN